MALCPDILNSILLLGFSELVLIRQEIIPEVLKDLVGLKRGGQDTQEIDMVKAQVPHLRIIISLDLSPDEPSHRVSIQSFPSGWNTGNW